MVSIVTDFIGAAFPIVLLWNVDIRLRSKIALCLLMGLGAVYVSAPVSLNGLLINVQNGHYYDCPDCVDMADF